MFFLQVLYNAIAKLQRTKLERLSIPAVIFRSGNLMPQASKASRSEK